MAVYAFDSEIPTVTWVTEVFRSGTSRAVPTSHQVRQVKGWGCDRVIAFFIRPGSVVVSVAAHSLASPVHARRQLRSVGTRAVPRTVQFGIGAVRIIMLATDEDLAARVEDRKLQLFILGC